MLDVNKILGNVDSNQLIGKMLSGMATKNFAAGLLSGGIVTSLLGGGKNTAKTAAKVGGLALLGTLAYRAYGNYQQQKAAGGNASMVDAVKNSATGMATQARGLLASALGGPQDSALPATGPAQANPELSVAIMRAMIGAAKADGHLDAAESQKIMERLDAAGATSEEKILLIQEMANAQDINAIAGVAKTPEESAQIYLAAVLVCDSQCDREREHLRALATALKLEPAFTANLQRELLNLSAQQEV